MRRWSVALALVVLAAACASAPTAAEPTVLRVILADDWASAPVVGEVIDRFEREHEGVRVQIQGSPFSQIPEVVGSAIELDQPHDVAHWHAFAAAAAGIAEPLDGRWQEAGLTRAEYLPGAYEHVVWDGGVYGVPLDVNALVLMANVEQLDEAGLDAFALANIDDFRASADTLVGASSAEHAITVTASSWAAYGWIVANGGSLVELQPDGTPRFTFDDPRTVAALELLAGLVRDGGSPPPFAPDLSLDAIAQFATGEVALHASGSWDLPITRRALQEEMEVRDVQVLPLPQSDPSAPRTVLGGSSLFVPVGAPNPDLAFELMLALTEDTVALQLAAQEGRLPARTRVYEAELFTTSADLAAFVALLDTAEVMPLIAYPEVATAFRDGLEDMLALRASAAEAMEQVQRQAERWGAGT